ncbi:MAG: DUF4258 domain-containing protein [Planctomycetota bacterium]|nr:DUF4258 domain-containing protein [Planctomycetota bacterium]
MRVKIRYYIDVNTGLPHINGHGVSEQEVEDILRNPIERRRGDGDSQVLIGQTGQGRFLRVIISLDDDQRGVFVITAYDLGGKPRKALRRRMRRRGQP